MDQPNMDQPNMDHSARTNSATTNCQEEPSEQDPEQEPRKITLKRSAGSINLSELEPTRAFLYEASKRLEKLEEMNPTIKDVVGVLRIKTNDPYYTPKYPYSANNTTNTINAYQHPEVLTYEKIHQNYQKHFPEELLSESKQWYTCLFRASSQDKIDPILDTVILHKNPSEDRAHSERPTKSIKDELKIIKELKKENLTPEEWDQELSRWLDMLEKEYEKKGKEYDKKFEEEDKLYNDPYYTSSTSSTTPPLLKGYPIQECQNHHQEETEPAIGTNNPCNPCLDNLDQERTNSYIGLQGKNCTCIPLTTTAILTSVLLALITTTSLVIWLLLP